MIPRRLNRELDDTMIQWMLTQSVLLHQARDKGKGLASPRDCCFKCGRGHYQRDCIIHVASHRAKAMARKANSASHGPGVLAKEKGKEGKGDGKSK